MIEELLHSTDAPNKEKRPNQGLPMLVAVSVVMGLVSGTIGGAIGARFLPGTFSDQQEKNDNTLPPLVLNEERATIEVVKRASESVVSIVIKKDLSKLGNATGPSPFPFDNFFQFGNPFFQFEQAKDNEGKPLPKQTIGGGSGFIISSDGLLLTNKHVISDDEAEYTVILNDGKEYSATILAKDPVNDVALIKIDAKDLKPLKLGDSSVIQIGQTVIAIGNTLGEYRNTVTRGVISGINRLVYAGNLRGVAEVLQEAIQTDAAINPGNSGGPLLNLAGEVIGINTAVNQEGQSIGFAIPVNGVKRSVESVKKYGRIIRPWLGVRYVAVDEELSKKNNLPLTYGALVIGNESQKELAVIPGSPAEKAGIQQGDVIEAINGQKIEQGHSLASEIGKFAPGDEITVRLYSKGREKEIRVKLEEFKEPK